jgi:CDP-diglyceride synthetase
VGKRRRCNKKMYVQGNYDMVKKADLFILFWAFCAIALYVAGMIFWFYELIAKPNTSRNKDLPLIYAGIALWGLHFICGAAASYLGSPPLWCAMCLFFVPAFVCLGIEQNRENKASQTAENTNVYDATIEVFIHVFIGLGVGFCISCCGAIVCRPHRG